MSLAELPGARRGQLFAGIDFGRKQHLTVCWILERVPARNGNGHFSPALSPDGAEREKIGLGSRWNFVTREVVTIQNTPTPQQLEILWPRLQRCNRICLDATGAGVGLGDYLVQRCGEWIPSSHGSGSRGRVELCQFSTALKAELFPRLRTAFEQRVLRIPISREIREDLHAIQRSVTQNGTIAYRAPQSADGHSDRTTALALALRAAQNAPASACARSIPAPDRGMCYERQSSVTCRLGRWLWG